MKDIKLRHKDCISYYNCVIRLVMAITKQRNQLQYREVDVLSVMCWMVDRGIDISSNGAVVDKMKELGLGVISELTMRNYKRSIRKKGWASSNGVRGSYELNSILSEVLGAGGLSISAVGCDG